MSNTQAMHNLCENIVESSGNRMMFLQHNSGEVREFLSTCRQQREGMRTDLFHELSENERKRKGQVKQFLSACHKNHRQSRSALFNGLAEGERQRKQRFIAFRNDLLTQQNDRNEATADFLENVRDEFLEGLRAEQEERNGEVHALLAEFGKDREGMAREWQKMTATMHSRRLRGSAPRHMGAASSTRTELGSQPATPGVTTTKSRGVGTLEKSAPKPRPRSKSRARGR